MDKTTLQRQLGLAVRARRVRLAHSQDSFADSIAMHRAYYSAIERGERNVTIHTLARVAAGLKVKVYELLRDAAL